MVTKLQKQNQLTTFMQREQDYMKVKKQNWFF